MLAAEGVKYSDSVLCQSVSFADPRRQPGHSTHFLRTANSSQISARMAQPTRSPSPSSLRVLTSPARRERFFESLLSWETPRWNAR